MFTGYKVLQPGDARTTTTTKEAELGSIGVTQDGRVYRYVEAAGTALDPGKLCVSPTIVANHANIAVASAAAVGATEVTVTLGATLAAVNDYAEGYMIVNDAAGEAIAYRVIGHPAAAASASLKLTLDPSESIRVALTTSSEVTLMKNPWKDVVISVSDQADMAVGVPNVTIAADSFGWVQTRGFCSVLADETIAVGSAVVCGSSVGGAVETRDSDDVVDNLGVAVQAGVDTEYRGVFLKID